VLGIVSGAFRTVRFRPLRAVATFYVEFFRNVPLLVFGGFSEREVYAYWTMQERVRQPSAAEMCVTRVEMSQVAPAGAPCFCPTVYGPVSGFAR
jgi:hypothetical protein